MVHCRYCWYTSSNIEECDRCGRVFAKNVKVITVKKVVPAEPGIVHFTVPVSG